MTSDNTADDAKKGSSAGGKQLHSATPPSDMQTSGKGGGGGLFDYLVKSRQKGSSGSNNLDGATKMSSRFLRCWPII